jgi:hypothetical protein
MVEHPPGEEAMTPISMPWFNSTYAKDQPQYNQLPAYRALSGAVTSCWHLTWRERLTILLRGRFFITQMTFNEPLQPILPRLAVEEEDE